MITRRFFHAVLVALAVGIAAGSAGAAELNAQDGIAIKGYDVVAYFTDHAAVPGSEAITTQFDGATFRFASAEHRDAFIADPEKYLPQFGGFCAYGTSQGHKADIDPQAFTVVDGKLYLNYSMDVRAKFSKDIPGFIQKANQNWSEVSKDPKVYR
jgi:YHS domain-containing protein